LPIKVGTALLQPLWHIVFFPLRPRYLDAPPDLFDRRFNLTRTNTDAFGLIVAIVDKPHSMLVEVANDRRNSLVLPILTLGNCCLNIALLQAHFHRRSALLCASNLAQILDEVIAIPTLLAWGRGATVGVNTSDAILSIA